MNDLPLSGVRILDLTRLIPGGVATLALSDLGADIVKVELPPAGDHLREYEPILDDGMGALFHALNRDKRSVMLDYRDEGGRTQFLELLESAQVLVEGFRPGTLAKYGLDHETLHALRPDLVYASITGYGQSEQFGHLPSHGMNMDAAAGHAQISMQLGDQPTAVASLQPGLPYSVRSAGLQAALAISAALHRAVTRGRGAYLDISCWDAAISSDPYLGFQAANGMDTAGHVSSKATPKIAPYITSDDKVLVLCPIEPHLWERFCAVIERPDLLPIEDVGAWDSGTSDLYPIVAEVMRSKTLQEWQELFTGAGVPASAVYSTSEAVHSPLASDRNILWPPAVAGQPSYVGPAVVVDGQRGRPHVSPPPRLGQHNDALLEGAS